MMEEEENIPFETPTPEADLLFMSPTPEESAHILRDLTWGDHMVATRMAPSRGNTISYFYNLKEAALFFFDDNSGGVSLGSSGAFAWIDLDKFIAWLRDVIGDKELARVLEEHLVEKTVYNDKVEVLRHLLLLRMSQLEPHLFDEDESDEGEEEFGN